MYGRKTNKKKQNEPFVGGRLFGGLFTGLQPLIASLLLLCCFTASAAEFPNEYELEGYDVVSYFSETGPVIGEIKHAMKYDGKYYAFANAEHAEKFRLDPEKYLPAYGGYCAYGMVHGMKSSVDPLLWEIVDDRLFLLINQGTKKRWHKKNKKYIRKSDRAWARLSPY